MRFSGLAAHPPVIVGWRSDEMCVVERFLPLYSDFRCFTLVFL